MLPRAFDPVLGAVPWKTSYAPDGEGRRREARPGFSATLPISLAIPAKEQTQSVGKGLILNSSPTPVLVAIMGGSQNSSSACFD